MFKSRKRKFTKLKKKVETSSSEDDAPSVVKNAGAKNSRRNPNVQKTQRRAGFRAASEDEDVDRFESKINVNQQSKKSSKLEPDYHGVFSIKDRYETRKDMDFEAQQRVYGLGGFNETHADPSKVLGQGQDTTSKKAMNANHAVTHDDCVDPDTGEKLVGYRKNMDDTGEEKINRIMEGELMYKGHKQYTDWNPMQKKDPGTKLIRAIRGPVRAPTFMRVTTRWDYEKSTCRDWRECGYCVFGDCCKYIHDRSDLKHGWELEDKWKELNNIVDSDHDYTISSADDDEGDLPFRCFICRKSFVEPIETLCKHYFCLKCAMLQFRSTPKCYICKANTRGVFNPAKRIIARINPGGNDGIHDGTKKFGDDDEDEDDHLMKSSEDEVVEAEEEPIVNHVFRTRGMDDNDETEVAIVNEIEFEAMLLQKEAEARQSKRKAVTDGNDSDEIEEIAAEPSSSDAVHDSSNPPQPSETVDLTAEEDQKSGQSDSDQEDLIKPEETLEEHVHPMARHLNTGPHTTYNPKGINVYATEEELIKAHDLGKRDSMGNFVDDRGNDRAAMRQDKIKLNGYKETMRESEGLGIAYSLREDGNQTRKVFKKHEKRRAMEASSSSRAHDFGPDKHYSK